MSINLKEVLHAKEKELIDEALAKHQGNKAAAARELEMNRTTLCAWMERNGYEMQEPSAKMEWEFQELDPTVRANKIQTVKRALVACNGNKTHAAKMLGSSIRMLRKWVDKYEELADFKWKNGVQVKAGNS